MRRRLVADGRAALGRGGGGLVVGRTLLHALPHRRVHSKGVVAGGGGGGGDGGGGGGSGGSGSGGGGRGGGGGG